MMLSIWYGPQLLKVILRDVVQVTAVSACVSRKHELYVVVPLDDRVLGLLFRVLNPTQRQSRSITLMIFFFFFLCSFKVFSHK